jgi:hypothetical protein
VCFPLNVLMVHSLKLAVIANGECQTGIRFAIGETIRFGSLQFIADRSSSLSLSPEGNDSDAIFVRMVHSGSSSLHTILKEFTDEGDTTSSERGKLWFPHLLRVQHGDPDYPHHNHTTTGGHSSASDHPDGPTADCHITTRHWAPS